MPSTKSTGTAEPPVWLPDAGPEVGSGREETAAASEPRGTGTAPNDRLDGNGEASGLAALEPLTPLEIHHPARRGSRAVTWLLGIGALVLAVGLSFAVGRATAPASSAANGANGANGGFGGAPNGEFDPGANGVPADFGDRGGPGASVQGTVVSVENGVITVKLADGSTVQATTTSSTTYRTQQTANASDVTAGKTVTIRTSGAAGSSTRTASDVTITGN